LPAQFIEGWALRHGGNAPFSLPPRGGLGPGLAGDALSDRVQPASQRSRASKGAAPAGQDQEGCLEGILRSVGIAEHAPAHREHHGAMPLHQQGEGGFIALMEEMPQQIEVSEVVGGLCSADFAQRTQDVSERSRRHGPMSPGGLLPR
jgi:hypothetical protein